MFTCTKCLVEKSISEFYKSNQRKRGHQSWCKTCSIAAAAAAAARKSPRERSDYMKSWHDRNRGKQYGLTPEQYAEMVEKCGGVCEICGDPPRGKRSRLLVDHDHVTGKVRGMVCHPCNSGLGLFQDDADRLRSAARWVSRHRRNGGTK